MGEVLFKMAASPFCLGGAFPKSSLTWQGPRCKARCTACRSRSGHVCSMHCMYNMCVLCLPVWSRFLLSCMCAHMLQASNAVCMFWGPCIISFLGMAPQEDKANSLMWKGLDSAPLYLLTLYLNCWCWKVLVHHIPLPTPCQSPDLI